MSRDGRQAGSLTSKAEVSFIVGGNLELGSISSLLATSKQGQLKRISIKKGQILQSKGELHSKIYTIKSGLLRSYSIDEKGKEHIFMFAPAGWVIADSTPPDLPSELFIDALEDSEAVMLYKEEEDKVDYKKFINRVNTLQQRIIMLMSATAIDRYEHFIETYPDIVQRIPQRMIASYLGITPEALSKVKGDRKRAVGNKEKS